MEDQNKTENSEQNIESIFDGNAELEQQVDGITEDPKTGLTGEEKEANKKEVYELDYSEFTALLDRCRDVAAMTATSRWKNKWQQMIERIKCAKNRLADLDSSSADDKKNKATISEVRFFMEQECHIAEELNTFIKDHPLFLPNNGATITAADFDYESGVLELVPIDSPKDCIAAYDFPHY